jgi:hypothetical protein
MRQSGGHELSFDEEVSRTISITSQWFIVPLMITVRFSLDEALLLFDIPAKK